MKSVSPQEVKFLHAMQKEIPSVSEVDRSMLRSLIDLPLNQGADEESLSPAAALFATAFMLESIPLSLQHQEELDQMNALYSVLKIRNIVENTNKTYAPIIEKFKKYASKTNNRDLLDKLITDRFQGYVDMVSQYTQAYAGEKVCVLYNHVLLHGASDDDIALMGKFKDIYPLINAHVTRMSLLKMMESRVTHTASTAISTVTRSKDVDGRQKVSAIKRSISNMEGLNKLQTEDKWEKKVVLEVVDVDAPDKGRELV